MATTQPQKGPPLIKHKFFIGTLDNLNARMLSVWGQEIIFFSILVICVSRGMFLKGVDERFLLSEDERLTPDIDEVMAVSVF